MGVPVGLHPVDPGGWIVFAMGTFSLGWVFFSVGDIGHGKHSGEGDSCGSRLESLLIVLLRRGSQCVGGNMGRGDGTLCGVQSVLW